MPFNLLAGVFVIMSIVTYCIYYYDKRQARRRGRRVRESTLLILAACFGSAGAYIAMRTLRHKTRHLSFNVLVPTFLAVHLLILAYIYWRY